MSFSAFFIAKKAIYHRISNLALCQAVVPMQPVSGATVYVSPMLKKLPLRSMGVTSVNSCILCRLHERSTQCNKAACSLIVLIGMLSMKLQYNGIYKFLNGAQLAELQVINKTIGYFYCNMVFTK